MQALVQAGEQILPRAPDPVRTWPHVVAGFGGDDELVAASGQVGLQDPAEILLGGPIGRAIVVREVEVGDAKVEGTPDDRPLGLDRPVAAKVLPEPERHGRQHQAAAAGPPEGHSGVALAVLHHVHSSMVVVCGEALIDRIVGVVDSPGGGPFTTPRALARLGVPAQFLGHLSRDAFGDQVRDLLAADGADLAMTSVGPEPTTLAIAEVNRDGHAAYRFVSDGTAAPNLTSQMVPASFGPDVNALHVGTLGLVFEPIATTIAALVD